MTKTRFALTRRQLLAGAGAAAAVPGKSLLSQVAKRPKVILELTRDAATNSMRAVERIVWVVK